MTALVLENLTAFSAWARSLRMLVVRLGRALDALVSARAARAVPEWRMQEVQRQARFCSFIQTADPVTQSTSNLSPPAFSQIREYFKLRAEIFSPAAALKTRICNSETIVEFKKRRVGGLLRRNGLSI